MDEFLELDIRRNIYNVIEKYPGIHLSQLARMLNIRISLLEYHLLFLEKNQIISVSKRGYSRYFIRNQIGHVERQAIMVLRQEIPLKIVLFLLDHPYSRHGEILKHINKTKSTLSYHLNKLIDQEIIVVQQDVKEQKCYTVNNEKEMYTIITKYKPYNLIESFNNIWGDLRV